MRTPILVAITAAAAATLAAGASVTGKIFSNPTCAGSVLMESVFTDKACLSLRPLYARVSYVNGAVALQNYDSQANCFR
ncbi:uncharacterized protein EV422DRAFT_547023 [Fimicolochytrium jonesii]|uniref:uncharacterized protein n=1 Tax=Fimicolochytrium jonesii TaxID=1396493 RepID=UPI0022FF3A05|nr:uncharacterized protein EV422DRAFT_547023 [Fimicolochytrium jonesii]KAI8816172.1 hypothetical protein EV422DRAFT_547023 [Fimicolochytrium jonesii]